MITQHLIMATDSTGNVRLLPRDLEVINYVVSQVSMIDLSSFCFTHEISDVKCPGDQNERKS